MVYPVAVGPQGQEKSYVLTYPLFPTKAGHAEIKKLEASYQGQEFDNKLKSWVAHKICYLKDGQDYSLLKDLTTALQHQDSVAFLKKWNAVRTVFPQHPVQVWEDPPSPKKMRRIIF